MKKGFAGAVLVDLSKAFDCLDHELLIAKLSAYGFDRQSLNFIWDYLKIGSKELRLVISLVLGMNYQ